MAMIWNDIRKIRQDVARDVAAFKMEVKADIKEVRLEHSSCEKTLPDRFAPREEVGKLHGRIDEQAASIHYMRGRINGHVEA